MKVLIKKLKSCRYSIAAIAPGRDEPFHNTRHRCDHPVMRVDWKLERCEKCRYYEAISKPAPVHTSK